MAKHSHCIGREREMNPYTHTHRDRNRNLNILYSSQQAHRGLDTEPDHDASLCGVPQLYGGAVMDAFFIPELP